MLKIANKEGLLALMPEACHRADIDPE